MLKKNIFILLLITSAIGIYAADMNADALLKEMEETLMPVQYYSEIDMKTFSPGKSVKEMSMNSWYKKDTGSYIELTAPSRSRGTRMLAKNNSLWMYNQRSGSTRALRLSPKDNFQGSVFSNNDVGDPQYSDDYTAQIKGRKTVNNEELGDVECYLLEAIASDNESPYGRIEMLVTVNGTIPLEMTYYAKSGLLFKKMNFSGFQNVAGKIRPLIYRMDSVEEQETYSIVEIKILEMKNDLPDSMFTENRLTR
jgi:outer membrane lipoprotein-sorting protein